MAAAKVASYLRLSRDDERSGESASIENQRAYLRQYAVRKGWEIIREYVDDGYSGLTFDRPGFRNLLSDIERGDIDTVLTKDLSRLGRDQIYTAFYYQIYFPQRNVRYIAVAEGFDTADAGMGGLLVPFLTAANDFYTADVSRKVRAALMARKRDGKFIGAQAPLGYRKDPNQPGHLIVDRRAAPIISMVFCLYRESGSVNGVARELTRRGIPTPQRYRAENKTPGSWSGTMVRRILSNPTYAGNLTQNRRVKVNYKLKKRRNLPEGEWITVPNTHEAIIAQQEFDRVQEMLLLHSYCPERRKGGHVLSGLAFCADCGSAMTYTSESAGRSYMVCGTYRKGAHRCTAHRIREDQVLTDIAAELRRIGQAVRSDVCERICCQFQKGDAKEITEKVERLLAFGQLERKTAMAVLNRVTIGEAKNIEVRVSFRDPAQLEQLEHHPRLAWRPDPESGSSGEVPPGLVL